MTRPFETRIFLDSGDPADTQKALEMIGFLDGQTTNPSLVAKNPDIKQQAESGEGLTEEALLQGYKSIVNDIHELLPGGAISIEVYADATTTADAMVAQARDFVTWLSAPYIKLPCTTAGLEAASILTAEGIRVNMTLCFTQEQALAVHMATAGAAPGSVFISPFLGRLDDKGVCGLSLIHNIVRMYRELDSHVEVLAASIRSVDHIYACVNAGAHILTVPFKLFNEWNEKGLAPADGFAYTCSGMGLADIEYRDMQVDDWHDIDITHELTDVGLEKFSNDWNNLIS